MNTTLSNIAFLLCLVSLVCALCFGLAAAKQMLWLQETRGEEMVFRQPALVAVFGLSLSLCFFLFPVALVLEGQPLEPLLSAIWFFGSVGLVPLLLLSPEEFHVDVEQRTLWWEKGWIWRHRRTGTLDDMAGVCTTRKSVMLVFKKRQFIGYGLTLGRCGGTVTAEGMAEMLGLSVINFPR